MTNQMSMTISEKYASPSPAVWLFQSSQKEWYIFSNRSFLKISSESLLHYSVLPEVP